MALSLVSCTSRKTVIRDRTLMEEYYKSRMMEQQTQYVFLLDSLRNEVSRRDTSWVSDSLFVRTEYRNDTVFVERFRDRQEYHGLYEMLASQQYSGRRDSVTVVHDTVLMTVDYTAMDRETEVTKTDRTAMKWLIVMLASAAAAAVWYMQDKFRR